MQQTFVNDIAVYVFSYNRAAFLHNCVESVRNYFSASIFVVDDNSEDPQTRAVLESLPSEFGAIAADRGPGEVKTGGLYANMNLAIRHASGQGFTYAYFIQDDMQVVRPLLTQDLGNFHRFFSENSRAIQLDTCFRKRQFERADRRYCAVDASGTAYFRAQGHVGTRGISQLGMFHVPRFLEIFGEFERGEVTNERKALSLGLQVGYYARPNMMWLPFPESWRGKAKGLYLHLQERLGRAGFYPYRDLSEEQVEQLFARDVAEMPVAEDWLSSPSAPPSPRWSFAGGLDNIRARGGAYAVLAMALGKLEQGRRQ